MANNQTTFTVRLNIPVSPNSRSKTIAFQEVSAINYHQARQIAQAKFGVNNVSSVYVKQ